MNLRLTLTAERDLDSISRYLNGRNPTASARVREAIVTSMRNLVDLPSIGHAITPSVRRIVVPRFGYLIYYTVLQQRGEISILSIRHPSRRRIDER
jgi:plasmid stabilization system protein ParE